MLFIIVIIIPIIIVHNFCKTRATIFYFFLLCIFHFFNFIKLLQFFFLTYFSFVFLSFFFFTNDFGRLKLAATIKYIYR